MITENDTYRSYVDKIEEIYNNWEKATGENTMVSLSPVRKGKMTLGLKGNTEQDGTPTPDNPIDVNVVTGENKVVVSNKNLLDLSKSEIGGIDTNGNPVNNNQNWRATDFIPVKPNTTYTYSRDYTETSTYLRLYEYDKNFNFISPRTQTSSATNTITTKSNTRYLKWTTYQNITTMTIDIVTSLNLQIEGGEQRTDHIQHQEQSFPISLGSLELCKKDDYQDYIYRQNGNWYLHNEIQKATIVGDDSYSLNTQQTNTLRFSVINAMQYNNKDTLLCICNRLQPDSMYSADREGLYTPASSKNLIFRINKSLVGTTETTLKAWLASNNIIVYGVMETPTDTEITNQALISQLEDLYNNAKSYDTTTNITQENANLPFIINASALKKGGN